MKTVKADVLIVGGGGAGFRAAIASRQEGAETLLISKGPLARCGASPMAGADLTCHGVGMREAGFFGEPNDSEEKFLSDIVHQGCFLNDQVLAERFVQDGPSRMMETLDWGCQPYLCDERAIFTSGIGIVDAHLKEARRLGTRFMDDTAVLELMVQEGQVCGAIGLDLRSGERILIDCHAVILASGGWHKAYTPVTGSKELTGDGVAMAYRAGAEVANMEFVTFACNVPLWPPIWRGSIVTYAMSLMCGGTLENADGERFLDRFDPEMVEIASTTEWNKSFFSFATALEVRAGRGTEHGGVYYVKGDTPWPEFEAKALRSYPDWKVKGADFSELGRRLRDGEGVEVAGAAEYFEGGVWVDERFASTLPGLYAAGECAVSLFGANRVAAATMEMLVTGAIAGKEAADFARTHPSASPHPTTARVLDDKITKPLRNRERVDVGQLRSDLQKAAASYLGPVRCERELVDFVRSLERMQQEVLPVLGASHEGQIYNKAWIECLELENMLTVLELSARSALQRTESRGVHYREDHPFSDNDQWLREIHLSLDRGERRSAVHPVRQGSLPLPSGRIPYLTMIHDMMRSHSDVGGHH